MTELEEIEKAIAALETQRASLGSAAVEAAQAGLRRRLAEIGENAGAGTGDNPETPWVDERKPVTILFADISGFTALSEKTDPETVRELINACFSRLVPIVQKYEGTVEKYIGDEIMAVFGAPVAHENDAERAALTALEMMKKLQEFNADQGASLGMHIGINTGPVVAGGIGSSQQQEYGVTGDAVNLAARLTEAAEHDQIFVGLQTRQLTASTFAYEALPAMRFKGKSEPIQVYQLTGLKEKPGRARGLEGHGIHSPMVGRSTEFRQLYASFQRLMDGQGGLVMIYGEAGLGKSRLLAEVHQNLPKDRILWMEGNLLAYGQNLSYWPFQEILKRYAGITEEDHETVVWSKLKTSITRLSPENGEEILPYLASLLSVGVPEEYQERVKYLDGEAMGKQIFLATWRFFSSLARQQPVALIIEDLHWIDASSENLFQHLLNLVPQIPLLILGLSRPENPAAERITQAARMIDPSRLLEINLSPLTSQESLKLLQNLLKVTELSGLQEPVISKAEGNPFFLEEVIRTLIDRQVVVPDAAKGTWRVTEKAGAIAIPDTIQGLIAARLDRLEEDVKQVLRLASVIGRTFLYRILSAISQDTQKVDVGLAELQEIELITEKQRSPELEYMFRHALAQEVTYESILLQKRRELHARVADAIETLFSDRIEEFYSLLAYHYARAEAWEKALDFLVKAGNQSGRIAADAEALEYYHQAMAAYGRMVGDRWDPLQRATLEHRMGNAYYRRGENTQSIEYLKSALAHLGYPVPETRLRRRIAILYYLGKHLLKLLPGNGYSFNLAEAHPPEIKEALSICWDIGWVSVLYDQEFFVLNILRSMDLAYQYQHPYMAAGFSSMGTVFDWLPAFRLAYHFEKLSLNVAEMSRSPYLMGMAYFSLHIHEALLGRYELSIKHARQAEKIYRETGDIRGWGLFSLSNSNVLISQGKFSQAREIGQHLLNLGNEVGDPQLRSWGMFVLGDIEFYQGHLELAHEHLQESTQLAKKIPDYYGFLIAGGVLGQCLLARGEFEQALADLEECRKLSKQYGKSGNSFTPVYFGWMKASLMLAERADPAQKRQWLAKARAARRDVLRQTRADRGGIPGALLLDGELERLQGNLPKARRLWQKSLAEAERMGMQYMVAMAHRELGRHFGDPEHRARADEIFTELGVLIDAGHPPDKAEERGER